MSASRFGIVAIMILGLIAGWPSMVRAFDTTGTIVGVVADAEGAVIAGAAVTIRNTGTNLTREVVTDDTGVFKATQLPVGEYEVIVEVDGFNKQQTRVVLQINQ